MLTWMDNSGRLLSNPTMPGFFYFGNGVMQFKRQMSLHGLLLHQQGLPEHPGLRRCTPFFLHAPGRTLCGLCHYTQTPEGSLAWSTNRNKKDPTSAGGRCPLTSTDTLRTWGLIYTLLPGAHTGTLWKCLLNECMSK